MYFSEKSFFELKITMKYEETVRENKRIEEKNARKKINNNSHIYSVYYTQMQNIFFVFVYRAPSSFCVFFFHRIHSSFRGCRLVNQEFSFTFRPNKMNCLERKKSLMFIPRKRKREKREKNEK